MAIRKLKKGRNKDRYQIDWRDEYGVRHWELVGNNYREPFEEVAKKYLHQYAKEKKVSWYTDHLKIRLFNRHFGPMRIGSITKDDIETFSRMEMMGHTSPITQRRYTHMADQKKVDAIKVLDGLRRKSVDVLWMLDAFQAKPETKSLLRSVLINNTN